MGNEEVYNRQAGRGTDEEEWGTLELPLSFSKRHWSRTQVCELAKITVQGGYTSEMQRQRNAFI